MKRHSVLCTLPITLALLVALLTMAFPLGATTVEASSATIYVPDDYTTIQAAVDAASPGDTIIVRDGTYTENVDVNKDHLTIKSENGAEITIVQAANPDDHVFEITADYVNIQGFTVEGATKSPYAGICLSGSWSGDVVVCNIFDNIASGNDQGICLIHCTNITLTTNTCSNNNFGLYFHYTFHNRIYLNDFISNRCSVDAFYSANLWFGRETYTYNGSTYNNYLLGNYWSDYSGSDADGDGIGDTPYSIGSQNDDYPLMEPFENYNVGTYDRQAAYEYAEGHWNEVCSDGYFWNSASGYIPLPLDTDITVMDGFDCAHFVSCCIGSEPNEQGGGLDVPGRVPPTYGEPGAARLGDWLISSGNAVEKTSVNELEMGDVINYDWNGDEHWDHVALYLGNSMVAAHTTCVWEQDWQLSGAVSYRFIHIRKEAANQLPVAGVDLDYAYTQSGTPIVFDGSSSNDPDGTIVNYQWDFGDGTVLEGPDLQVVEHRFRGAMVAPNTLELETKTYAVGLTVRDDKGATATDTAFVEVEPLQKPINVEPLSPPAPAGSYARMTAYYNWVGVTHDTAEDVYVVSAIHFEAQGFVSYLPSIWDEYSFSVGTPIWSQALVYFWQPVEKTFSYPFGTDRDQTYTFDDQYFEGMAVGPCDKMRLWAFDLVEISGVMGPTWDGVSASFAPDSAEEPIIDEAPPDLFLAHLCSPGELRVYDSQGNVTGLVNGEVEGEIPDSGYNDGIVVMLNPLDTYWYEVSGTDEATYGLVVTSLEDGEVTSFNAADIPTVSGAIHQYSIDWNALSQGEAGVTVHIDSDGDGTFEETITADNELTHDEFMLQTATTIDFDPDTLSLKSKGKYVTVYMELPTGYDVSQIDVSSIMLNDVVSALAKPTELDDYDSDGIPDLMVKFDRAAVQEILTAGEQVEITISGEVAGVAFEGSDIVRVMNE